MNDERSEGCRLKNLSLVDAAYANIMWLYRSPDPLDAVRAPGYFINARNLIRQGDTIMVVTDRTPAESTMLLVAVSNADELVITSCK